MLRLLHTIFGRNTTKGSYPESLIKDAIERAVDGTDPWLRAVSGYKKKLRPAVIRAIDHVVALVDGLAPPLEVTPGSYGNDPQLKAFFISTDEMRKVFAGDRSLNEFRAGTDGATSPVFALLAMEKQEKGAFGVALSGDIVMHDVPQVTVNFNDHRLIDPTVSEGETRRKLMHRAYDHLLSLALRRITCVKGERENLERHRTLLQSRLNLLQRSGLGFDAASSDETMDVAGVEKLLGEIDSQLMELGGDDRMLEVYLGILCDVLGRPEEHLWSRQETLFVDRMGIKHVEAADDAPELSLCILYNAEGRNLVVTLVALVSS
jgi:hypothetical protein